MATGEIGERQPKATELTRAIYSLDTPIENLQMLRDEIAGEGENKEQPEKLTAKGTSLAELLECGPDWINEKNARAHNLVDEIRAMLI